MEHLKDERRKLDAVTLERHVQTILIAVIASSIMFAGSYLFSDNRSKGELEQQVRFTNTQVSELRDDFREFKTTYQRRENEWVTRGEFKSVTTDTEARLRALEHGKK